MVEYLIVNPLKVIRSVVLSNELQARLEIVAASLGPSAFILFHQRQLSLEVLFSNVQGIFLKKVALKLVDISLLLLVHLLKLLDPRQHFLPNLFVSLSSLLQPVNVFLLRLEEPLQLRLLRLVDAEVLDENVRRDSVLDVARGD